jgi:hypothetical protein
VRTVGVSTDGHGRAPPALCFRLDGRRRFGRSSPRIRLGRVNSAERGLAGRRCADYAVSPASGLSDGSVRRSRPGAPGGTVQAGRYGACVIPARAGVTGWNGAGIRPQCRLSNVAGPCGHDACGASVLQQLARNRSLNTRVIFVAFGLAELGKQPW